METKVCKVCGIEKPIESFRREHGEVRKGKCKTCDYGHEPHTKHVIEKVCTVCKILKPIEEFDYTSRKREIRASYCKKCYSKKQWKRSKGTMKEEKQALTRKFGKTTADFFEKEHSIQTICPICGISLEEYSKKYRKRFCVDHDHTTGEVRALICGHCNSMLGFAKDNPEILSKGVDYLNFHLVNPSGILVK